MNLVRTNNPKQRKQKNETYHRNYRRYQSDL